jgi:2'-5' RNA ligase
MARLFTAIELPPAATGALAALRPPASAGVRLTDLNEMHITLHYIGESDCNRTAHALSALRVTRFSVSVKGVGQFQSADGAFILWAAVANCDDLLKLHERMGAILSVEGYRQDARPYTPHITLARCDPVRAEFVVSDFLARHADFTSPAIPVTGFGLYSSEFVGGVPAYRLIQFFPLTSTDQTPGI